jgi:hypothetical protein
MIANAEVWTTDCPIAIRRTRNFPIADDPTRTMKNMPQPYSLAAMRRSYQLNVIS